ncbi:MAG: RagB/SusD family nutrient uptake outer membrane protein [Bacteroidetes bacterium]|nr:RagB/SusD family nutrient uptake outer membrane protein [Bacteroidota bacterium]
MKQTISIKWMMLAIAGTLLTACNKMIEIGPPKDQLASSSVYLDTTTANAAVTGMYSKVANPWLSPSDLGTMTSMFTALSSDEGYHYVYTFYDPLKNNALTPDFYYTDAYWTYIYSNVYFANTIIEGVTGSSLPESYKIRVAAEGKFMRALSYYYLVNIFGSVPLVLSTDVNTTTLLPRESIANIYTQIEKDLTEAQAALPADYSIYGNKRIRATSWLAQAMLARMYLYQGNWAKAESNATAVLNNTSLFNLVTPDNVFLANSREGLLQFPPPFSSLWMASTLGVSATAVNPNFVLNTGLANAFESGDKRKTTWVGSFNISGTIYPYPAKYKYINGAGPVEYNQVMRLAELYLIRAEARTQQSKFTDAAADINAIRTRAGLANTTAADKASLLAAIEQENRIEFFFEWGHRWMDLKRWPGRNNPSVTRADEVLGALKGTTFWQPTDVFYPIPQTARNSNPNLTQNNGY